MKQLRVGLIGCGGIGFVHAKSWMEQKEKAVLVAIADFDTEKADKIALECGAAVYKDAHEMMQKEELDVVDICLPTFLHTDYCIAAMQYVKNIIVEKPVCLTEQEAQRLLEAQKATGALVQVAQVARFARPYIYLKEVLDNGRYGRLLTGNFVRISPKPVWVKDYDNVNRTGGMAVDLHIHDVDYIRYLMGGDPDQVTSTVRKDADGIVHHIWSTYRYKDAVLMAEGSWAYPLSMPFANTYRVMLEKATIIWDEKKVLTVYPEDGEAFKPQLEEDVVMDLGINISNFGVFLRELGCFADVIQKNSDSVVPLSEAISSLRLVKQELAIADKM